MNSQKQTHGGSNLSSQNQSADTPQAQAGYGNSQDEQGHGEENGSSQDGDAHDSPDEPQAGEAIPGETSNDPAQQARADGNPQLYEG
ncbi:hypothetical protein [Porphyrobacter sp. GA68]|uniref:hypothetical protein n=1 Tax=Porphyrobacter sp. GA68 TaxID=2883480 RepID=UPI001D17D7C8|nr:hypothetical protein [Porphyrobacter sp. GA68]